MDKITEELFESLIKKVHALEFWKSEVERIGKSPFVPKKQTQKTGLATEGQLRYLGILGAHIPEGMTKQDAGIEIDRLVKEKESVELPSVQDIKTKIDAEKVADEFLEIVEPKEVDNDDVGVDEEGLM